MVSNQIKQSLYRTIIYQYLPHWKMCDQYDVLLCVSNFVISNVVCVCVLTGNGEVSFVIPLEGTKDKFVIAVGRNVAILTWNGESSTPTDVKYVTAVDNEKELQSNRLNDGKADPTGRLWAGMV
jgi:hypothetical protein